MKQNAKLLYYHKYGRTEEGAPQGRGEKTQATM